MAVPVGSDFFGFEYGDLLSVAGGGLYFSITGTPTIQSTIKRSGTYALQASNSGTHQVQLKVQPSTTTFVGTAWFLTTDSLPGAVRRIMEIDNETVLNCWFTHRTNAEGFKLEASFEGNGPQYTAVAITANIWHWIDWKINLSADPTTLDWAYDGVQQTQVTRAGTGSNIGGIKVGNLSSSGSGNIYWDDIVYSTDSANFMKLSNYRVKGLVPNGEGTHNNAANVLEDGAGADINGTTVQAFPLIDDYPWSTTLGDRIQCNLAGSANYVGVTFPDVSETEIAAVKGYLGYAAAAAQGNNGATIVIADGLEKSIYGSSGAPADMSETTMFFKTGVFTPPASGWTKPILDGMVMRIGYSQDATPDPWWQEAMVEYLYFDSPMYPDRRIQNAVYRM